MIIAIIGGIGSGKSVSATKFMVDSKYHSYCNFQLTHPTLKNKITRIKKDYIIDSQVKEVLRSGREVISKSVNWDFWKTQQEKHGDFNIVLDEVHNLVHSRQAMSKWNTLMTMWLSQIRKVLGDKEKTHIILVSQKLARIDTAFRDLLHKIVYVEKIEDNSQMLNTPILRNKRQKTLKLPTVWIIQYHFTGENAVEKYRLFAERRAKTYDYRNGYIANPYFRYYDSYEIFGETDYL